MHRRPLAEIAGMRPVESWAERTYACAQDFYPLQILLNGAACYLRISLNLTAPVPNFAANGTLVEDSQSPITATDGQLTGMRASQMKQLRPCIHA